MMQFELPKERPSIIKVIGVGGGGSNAVNHMFRFGIKGVDFLVCNTDHQALEISPVPNKIQLGPSLTEGRGAGAIPEVGKNAAIENIDDLREILKNNTKMVFITAGMGGGTGTGAAPIIAGLAREMGILTVAIVTVPFAFEGKKRRAQADAGIEELKKNVDTLLVICNDKLREIHGNLKLSEAFGHADDILSVAAKSIAEIITTTLHINVDFADIQTVMKDSGVAIMGSASAEGDDRAMEAVMKALDSPLLNDNEIEGARFILLNITSGNTEVSMDEMGEITDYVQEQAGQSAEVIMGVGTDDSLGDSINVTIIATGFKTKDQLSTVIVKEEAKVLYNISGEIINKDAEPVKEAPAAEVKSNEPVLKTAIEKRPALFPVPVFKKPEINPEPVSNPVDEKKEIIPVEETRIVHQLTDEESETLTNRMEASNITGSQNEEKVATVNNVSNESEETSAEELIEMHHSPELKGDVHQDEDEDEKTFIFELGTAVEDEDTKATLPPAPVQARVNPVQPTNSSAPATATPANSDDPFARARERVAKLREMSLKINSPNGVSDLEKEPAYRRKGVHLDNVPSSDESDVSKFTLSNDSENRPEIKSNNSFLHDRVD